MRIEQYGWNKNWQDKWDGMTQNQEQAGNTRVPGRITGDFGSKYRVMTDAGETWGELAGKLRHTLTDSGEYPAIGDWVSLAMQDGESMRSFTGCFRATVSFPARWPEIRRLNRLLQPMWTLCFWSAP